LGLGANFFPGLSRFSNLFYRSPPCPLSCSSLTSALGIPAENLSLYRLSIFPQGVPYPLPLPVLNLLNYWFLFCHLPETFFRNCFGPQDFKDSA
jgi:hypothetical protein